MKNQFSIFGALLFFIITFSSCAAVEGIFKAGMGVGIFLVVLVFAVIIFLVSRLGKNK